MTTRRRGSRKTAPADAAPPQQGVAPAATARSVAMVKAGPAPRKPAYPPLDPSAFRAKIRANEAKAAASAVRRSKDAAAREPVIQENFRKLRAMPLEDLRRVMVESGFDLERMATALGMMLGAVVIFLKEEPTVPVVVRMAVASKPGSVARAIVAKDHAAFARFMARNPSGVFNQHTMA